MFFNSPTGSPVLRTLSDEQDDAARAPVARARVVRIRTMFAIISRQIIFETINQFKGRIYPQCLRGSNQTNSPHPKRRDPIMYPSPDLFAARPAQLSGQPARLTRANQSYTGICRVQDGSRARFDLHALGAMHVLGPHPCYSLNRGGSNLARFNVTTTTCIEAVWRRLAYGWGGGTTTSCTGCRGLFSKWRWDGRARQYTMHSS
jgi:hypothetical protein